MEQLCFSYRSFLVHLFFNGIKYGKLAILELATIDDGEQAQISYLFSYYRRRIWSRTTWNHRKLYERGVSKNEAIIVSGDTKVVPRGAVDKIFINTTGIGRSSW